MSRYLILLIINLPFILIAIVSAVTQYKLKHFTRRRMWAQILTWAAILVALIVAQPLYNWLLFNNWTDTESLSLFDVIQITAIVALIYIATRLRAKTDALEQRLASLHRETSIILSSKNNKNAS